MDTNDKHMAYINRVVDEALRLIKEHNEYYFDKDSEIYKYGVRKDAEQVAQVLLDRG